MVMVPLAPHSLRSRAAVTAEGEVVAIDLRDDEPTRNASLFIDGTLLEPEVVANRFVVRTGERPTTLLRYGYDGFYSYAAKTFL
jgi:NAD+ kinase